MRIPLPCTWTRLEMAQDALGEAIHDNEVAALPTDCAKSLCRKGMFGLRTGWQINDMLVYECMVYHDCRGHSGLHELRHPASFSVKTDGMLQEKLCVLSKWQLNKTFKPNVAHDTRCRQLQADHDVQARQQEAGREDQARQQERARQQEQSGEHS